MSVNPEFRTAKLYMACSYLWSDDKDNTPVVEAVADYGEKLYKHGNGVYFAEPDYFLENWKVLCD